MSIISSRLTPIIASVLVFVGFELLVVKPRLLWFVAPLMIAVVFMAAFFVSQGRVSKNFWRFMVSPFLFTVSGLLFFSFVIIESQLAKHLILLFIVLGLGVVLESIFKYFHNKERFFGYSLENVFQYTRILMLFFFFSGIYSINIFFGVPVWALLFLVLLVLLALGYQQYWMIEVFRKDDYRQESGRLQQKINQLIFQNKIKARVYVLVPVLVLLEVFWAVSFLPTSFYVNGLLLTVMHYGIMNVIRARLHSALTKKVVGRSLVWAGVALIIILFTARW